MWLERDEQRRRQEPDDTGLGRGLSFILNVLIIR